MINTVTTNQIWISVNLSLVVNTWYDLVVTKNSLSNASGIKVYVNGILQVTTTLTNNLSASSASGHNLTIGRTSSTGTSYFIGNISNTRIWNIEFNQSQVTQNYNGGTMMNNPIEIANLVFGWRGGTDGLFGTSWVFPEESGNNALSLPISVNMEYTDRTTDTP